MTNLTPRIPKRPGGFQRKQKCDRAKKTITRNFETDNQRKTRLKTQKIRLAKSKDTEDSYLRTTRLKNNRRSKVLFKGNETPS